MSILGAVAQGVVGKKGGVMRKALWALVAVAIVVVGCAKAPTPDEAYLAISSFVALPPGGKLVDICIRGQ